MGILNGIKVIDLSEVIAGPAAAMYLADQGADVVKVEPINGGQTRRQARDPIAPGFSPLFVALNRNKRSCCLNLRCDTGKQAFYRLVARSDVMISNLIEATAQKLGVGYDTLRKINPRLIYASITSYGSDSRFANEPGYDTTALARAGVFAVRRMPDGTPVGPPVFIGDYTASMMISYGICLALLERERSGLGQEVETPLQSMALLVRSAQLLRVNGKMQPLRSRPVAEVNVYQCHDSKWLFVIALNDDQWGRFCKVLGLEHLANDPSLDTAFKRSQHGSTIYQVVEAIIRTRPRDEWLSRFQEGEVPAAPVNESTEEVWEDEHVRESGTLKETEHPELGNIGFVGSALRLSRTNGEFRWAAPRLGEHTGEVMTELGYSDKEIKQFRESGSIG